MVKEKIKSKDISVIVQGAIIPKYTKKCLESIRKYLPEAQIILSSWAGTDVSALKNLYDKLLLNIDPGAELYCINPEPRFNNVNRQLVSTQNALSYVKTKYTLKLRTDFYLTGNKFLKYFECFPKRDEKYSIFNHRVMISQTYTRNQFSCTPTPFHVSDFYFFGLSEDIKVYFENTPLVAQQDIGQCSLLYPEKNPDKNTSWNYPPEQYYCIQWVKRYFSNIKFEDWSDWNDENINFSQKIIFNNFIILGKYQEDIFSQKHKMGLLTSESIEGIITYNIFYKEYKKLDSKVKLPQNLISREKLRKHLEKVITPLIPLKNWLSELISLIYYTVRYVLGK